jgi:hypothetical protein
MPNGEKEEEANQDNHDDEDEALVTRLDIMKGALHDLFDFFGIRINGSGCGRVHDRIYYIWIIFGFFFNKVIFIPEHIFISLDGRRSNA